VGQFDKEASQTRDYCVAKNALRRATLAQGRLKDTTRGSPGSLRLKNGYAQDDKVV